MTGKRPSDFVALGVSHVPEGRKLFAGMTVQENLLMGAYVRRDGRQAVAADLEWVYGLFPRLKERRHQLAGTLSGGEQQMCALGRGLMARPSILLIVTIYQPRKHVTITVIPPLRVGKIGRENPTQCYLSRTRWKQTVLVKNPRPTPS